MRRLTMLVLVVISIASVRCVQISQTKISPTRSQLRNTLCNYYNANFTDSQRSHSSSIISQYKNINDDQIKKRLFNLDFSNPSTSSILSIAPHAICLCVLILMVPGLACCCARPDRYPVCKNWRKPDQEMYTKVELKWPAYCLVFMYLVVTIGSAGALFGGPDFANYINNVGCRLTALADDTLNGRISPSNPNTFFTGLTPFKAQLTDFSSKYDTFFSQSNSSLNSSQSVRTMQASIENQIKTQFTTYTNVVYNSAFRQSDGVTYVTVNSQFKDLYYGPANDTTKILGNIYSQLQSLFSEVNTALDPMIAAWVNLQPQSLPGIRSLITSTISQLSLHETQLQQTLSHYSPFNVPVPITQIQPYYNQINLLMKLIYGLVLSIAILGLISSIILAICSVVRIRLLLYFTCSFLIFLAVVCFVMLAIFVGLYVRVGETCAYVDSQLGTQQGMVGLLSDLQFNASAALYGKCSSSSGTGDIINQLNPNFTQYYQNIDLISDYTLKFNDLIPNFQAANFQRPFDQATALIDQIKTIQKLQINDTVALNFLADLANKAFVMAPPGVCDSTNVNADSWVPSRQVLNCQSGKYSQRPCTNLGDMITCPQGCYQMYQQFNTPLGDSSTYTTDLATRYNSGCNYASFLTQLQDHWTIPKLASLSTVTSSLSTIRSSLSAYQQKISTIQGSLNSFKSNLIQNFNSQTNQQFGTFNGMDCRVLGESINALRDSFCVGVLNSAQFNMIMLCLVSYGVLFLACFTVCAGVRHYQHLQKLQVKVGYKGVPVKVTSNRTIDKFDT